MNKQNTTNCWIHFFWRWFPLAIKPMCSWWAVPTFCTFESMRGLPTGSCQTAATVTGLYHGDKKTICWLYMIIWEWIKLPMKYLFVGRLVDVLCFLTLTNSVPTVSGQIMGYTGNYHAIWWYHVISHFRGWRSPNPGDRNRRTVIPRRSSNTAQGCLDVRCSWLMGCPTTGYNML